MQSSETKVFKSPFPGAEMITFLAPASMCPAAWEKQIREFHGQMIQNWGFKSRDGKKII